jgi:hypothetical protein
VKTLEVIVSPTGEAVVQTKGFTGATCRQASHALEQALGIKQSDTPTAEMHQHQTVEQPLRQTNG